MIVGLKLTDRHGTWRALAFEPRTDMPAEQALIYVQLLSHSAVDHGLDMNHDVTWSWMKDDA